MHLTWLHRPWFSLGMLLLLGALLRFWVPGGIPLTSDEISALLRTKFSGFQELMDLGVAVDGHPPLVQIFLFYWLPLVGERIWLIKLPFVIISLISIYQIWWLGNRLFGRATAFWVGGFMAVMPYFLYYGQVARPYAPGLCGVLWMAQMLVLLVSEKPCKRHIWLQFLLAAWLCAFSHYFAALQALVLWISAGVLVPKHRRLFWLLSALVLLLGFAPYAPIFFKQLAMGGIGGPNGWLGEPDERFLGKFLHQLFSFNSWLYGSAAFLGLCGFYMYPNRQPALPGSFWWLALWFLVPLAVGFGYSIWVNPVLQPAVMLFSSPFLLLLLGKGLACLPNKVAYAVGMLWLTVAVFWTQGIRKHNVLMAQEPFRGLALDAQVLEMDPEVCVWLDFPLNRWHFFGGAAFPEVGFDGVWSQSQWCQGAQKAAYGMLPSSPPEPLLALRRAFPYLLERRDFLGGTRWLWSKNPKDQKIRPVLRWKLQADSQTFYSEMDSDSLSAVFSKALVWPACRLVESKNDWIFAAFYFTSKGKGEAIQLVSEWYAGGERVDWRSFKGQRIGMDGWVCYGSIPLADVLEDVQADHWRLLVWNPEKVSMLPQAVAVEVWPGNPILYGLNEPF